MRLTISLLFTLLMASSALAQFKVTPNPEVNYGNGSFECGIVRLYPRENDDDPIYKINLYLIFKDGDALKRIQPNARLDESGFLNAFDSNRDLMCAAAARIYVRGSRGSYDLVAASF
jgi:hypothetical protein